MPKVTAIYGEEVKSIEVAAGTLVGDAIAETGLPLEQPCAGRGTCGQCKVLAETGLAPPDEVEEENLTPGETAVGNRLACRARVQSDTTVTLAPIVVYSNKIFRASHRYRRQREVPLGLAIDLGSTTVAALLTMLDNGEVCVGAAGLNQQTVYGADVISRLAAGVDDAASAARLQRLALASINQAVDGLHLSSRHRARIREVTVVGNVAMHHLLLGLPLESLAGLPFQPVDKSLVRGGPELLGHIFSDEVTVTLPPLIGGFVGSDALACLAYFHFDNPPGPIAAIDLGTNGEVMVSDGDRIVTASTAAGPAFEGVNISCGMRAVDGAIVAADITDERFQFETIAGEAPVGVTGTGLLSLVHELVQAGVVEKNGRISPTPPLFADRLYTDAHDARCLNLTASGSLTLTQWDVRELQKAKAAIRAATDILLARLDLVPQDLQRVILTGSFGGQIDVDAVLALGMIPPVRREAVETIANGAGLGAATFLTEAGMERAERLAARAEQIDLDLDADFNERYVMSMALAPSD